MNNITLSSVEISYLQTIAEACVKDIGLIVNVAKNLIPDCIDYEECNIDFAPLENDLQEESVDLRSSETYFSIAPNPAIDHVVLNYDLDNISSISILDAGGKVVKVLSTESNYIKLDFPAGIYYLKLDLKDGESLIEKLVVVK